MLILGLQGSPRKKGNTNFLLSACMQAAEARGGRTRLIQVAERRIQPCMEYVVCERKGTCPIKDDMAGEIYGLLRQAEIVILASPIFFYNMTSQLKALVDRCQTFWARKYRLKLRDPLKGTRRGFVLSVGATKGQNLFEGLQLTARYFFDAIDAHYEGSLVYRGIEGPRDLEQHPTVREDVERVTQDLLAPYAARKRVLFVSRANACRSQMAGALLQSMAGRRFEAMTAGTHPADKLDADAVAVMAENKIDLAFLRPQSLKEVLVNGRPDLVISLGRGEDCPSLPGAERQDWDLPAPSGQPQEVLRRMRDEIESRVRGLIESESA